MNKYIYCGPVVEFGRCIASNWKGETYASSEKKAKCNLAYQYKRQNNKTAATKITLPGNLTVEE